MSLRRPGPLALALAIIGFGVLALVVRDLALFWEPVPAWVPAPAILAAVSGAFLVSAGTGLFFARSRTVCAWALTIFWLVWVVARSSTALQRPARVVGWLSVCEELAQAIGVFLFAVHFSRAADRSAGRLTSNGALLGAHALFGVCCLVFGISHVAYAEFTAAMVPRWLPAHEAMVYLTGAGHAAAGLALLTRRWDRLAMTLEASMLGLFVMIVHLPSLWATPAPPWAPTATVQWTEILIALSVAGAAGTVAESLGLRASKRLSVSERPPAPLAG